MPACICNRHDIAHQHTSPRSDSNFATTEPRRRSHCHSASALVHTLAKGSRSETFLANSTNSSTELHLTRLYAGPLPWQKHTGPIGYSADFGDRQVQQPAAAQESCRPWHRRRRSSSPCRRSRKPEPALPIHSRGRCRIPSSCPLRTVRNVLTSSFHCISLYRTHRGNPATKPTGRNP